MKFIILRFRFSRMLLRQTSTQWRYSYEKNYVYWSPCWFDVIWYRLILPISARDTLMCIYFNIISQRIQQDINYFSHCHGGQAFDVAMGARAANCYDAHDRHVRNSQRGWHLGRISQADYELRNGKFSCSTFVPGDQIRFQFCTCHDSSDVVTYAKS